MTDQNEPQTEGYLAYLKIDAAIFTHPNLSHLEMLLFSLIELYDGEDHCYASNKHLALILGCSEVKISNGINKLINLRLVKKIAFDGRKRFLAINTRRRDRLQEKAKSYLGRLKREYKADSNASLSIIRERITNKIGDISPNSSGGAVLESSPTDNPSNEMRRTTKIPKPSDPSDPEYPDLRPDQHWALEYWNRLPLTPKHPNSTTKTYKRCATIFNQLENGTFAKGPRRKKILKFIKAYNLPYHNAKWTRDMIRIALDRMAWLFRNQYFKKGTHNLANILFNHNSPKEFYSPFLYTNYHFKRIKRDIELGGGPDNIEDIDTHTIWIDKREYFERQKKKPTEVDSKEMLICLHGQRPEPLTSKEKDE